MTSSSLEVVRSAHELATLAYRTLLDTFADYERTAHRLNERDARNRLALRRTVSNRSTE